MARMERRIRITPTTTSDHLAREFPAKPKTQGEIRVQKPKMRTEYQDMRESYIFFVGTLISASKQV